VFGVRGTTLSRSDYTRNMRQGHSGEWEGEIVFFRSAPFLSIVVCETGPAHTQRASDVLTPDVTEALSSSFALFGDDLKSPGALSRKGSEVG
jgi:hypothetical protein